MTTNSPIDLICYTAEKLADICDQVVFLGGAVVSLLAVEEGALPPRITKDVDIAVVISSQMDYYRLNDRLLALGFTNDMRGPICRYLYGSVMLDVIPVQTNQEAPELATNWHQLAVATAQPHILPNGIQIRLITPQCFLGTKMSAFNDVGRENHDDIFTSRDFGDMVRVVDGRPSIASEVLEAPDDLREYLKDHFGQLLVLEYLEEAISEHVDGGREGLVIDRIRSLTQGTSPR